jgi:hypothetical protein
MRTILRTALCTLVMLAGCGQAETPLTAVSGRVFYQHRPLASGTIVFTPDPQRGGRGPQAWGEIHDGQYRLFTQQKPGAVPGWHRITIAALPGEAAPVRLPARYRDPELSDQCREVKLGQENVVDLDLE